MAYSIFIDDFELDEGELEGFSSLIIERGISERYFGYWNADGFGFSAGTTTDKLTVKGDIANYIINTFADKGFAAEIKVRIVNGQQTSNLLIDFSQYTEDCCTASFSLRPSGGGDIIKSRDEISYPVSLTEEIEVPLKELPNVVNFNVVNETFIAQIGQSRNHNIPFKVGTDNFSDGTSTAVSVSSTNALFISNSTQCIEINGTIKVNVLSNIATTFTVYINDLVIDTFPINSTITEQTITVNSTLNLTTSQEVRITVKGGIGFAQFIYDTNSTGLNVQKCQTNAITYKKIKAISLKNAFKNVISQMSGGVTSLGDYYFDNMFFDSYLTNNDGLQNEVGKINVSFFKLFDELNNKFPTSISVQNNLVSIVARETFYKCENPYLIDITDPVKTINSAIIYSSIKCGYNNWKADSSFSSLEYNSTREFQSDYAISSKTLSLLNDWSASGSIITEQILKRKEKEETHWIIVNKALLRAETNEKINANVFQKDRAINLRITPTRNLERHSMFLLNSLKFASGTGNYNFNSTDSLTNIAIDETQNISNTSIFGKFTYAGTLDACDVQLEQLHGCVMFEFCGETKFGFLKNVKYKTSDFNGVVDVEIIELNLA